MAAQVNMPKKENPLGKILPLAGALAAGAAAIPTGGMSLAALPAVLGAAGAGQAAGSLGANILGANKQGPSAVERRMGMGAQMPQAAPAEDPQKILQESMFALKQQPPEVQKQYGPTLQAAMLKLNRGQV